MYLSLNNEQAKGLSNFFFDIAKGLVLGGIGFATFVPSSAILIFVSLSAIFAFLSIKLALSILEEVK